VTDEKTKRDAGPEAQFCRQPGQPCWKVKRAAEAAAEALAAPEAEARNPFCNRPGQPCWKAKRAVDELAEAATAANASS
jgi:hypothetical protein